MKKIRSGKISELTLRPSALPVWLGSLFLGVMLIVAGLLISESYRSAIRIGEARATAVAQTVGANADWMMQASNQALRRIDAALGPDGLNSSSGQILDIAKAVGDLPAGFTYSAFDEQGALRFSNLPNAQTASHKDRNYFKRLAGGEDLAIARLSKDEQVNASAFIIARRIERGGVFKGAASITISNQFVDRFWSTIGLGPHSTVSIVRSDGWLMARHPEPDEPDDLSKTA